jgi:hypothetical protein
MKGAIDTVSDVLDNDFIGETVGVTDPTMNGIANPFLEEGSKAATQAGYASGAWSAIKAPLDLVGIGGGLFNTFYQGRRHGKMETQKKYAAAELAHKEQKSAIKKAGVSSLSLAGNVSGAVGGFGIDLAGKVSGGFGVGLSAIDMARNTYGASRAFWKGHKLNQTRDKIEAYRTGINATTNPDEAKSAGELSEAARYMRNKKRHSGTLKTIGAVAAGLGVAGGIASLVGGGIGTPLGFGLMTAGAGIGAAIGAYKLGRGIYKRAHRRNKLSRAEQELGITRPKATGVKGHLSSAWNWLRGKDIENRQKEVEKKLDEKESAATTQPDKDTAAALRKKHYAAYKTQKDRHVGVLMKQMMESKDTPLRGHARHLGRTLGVLNKSGQLIQSRGWKFWRKKADRDLADIKEDEDKDAMEELIKRKVSL